MNKKIIPVCLALMLMLSMVLSGCGNSNTLTLNALDCALIVTVEFSNETHLVTFGSDTAGNGKVTATQLGTALVSGNPVVGGSSVTFTATPLCASARRASCGRLTISRRMP